MEKMLFFIFQHRLGVKVKNKRTLTYTSNAALVWPRLKLKHGGNGSFDISLLFEYSLWCSLMSKCNFICLALSTVDNFLKQRYGKKEN